MVLYRVQQWQCTLLQITYVIPGSLSGPCWTQSCRPLDWILWRPSSQWSTIKCCRVSEANVVACLTSWLGVVRSRDTHGWTYFQWELRRTVPYVQQIVRLLHWNRQPRSGHTELQNNVNRELKSSPVANQTVSHLVNATTVCSVYLQCFFVYHTRCTVYQHMNAFVTIREFSLLHNIIFMFSF